MRAIGSKSHYIGVSTRRAIWWLLATTLPAATVPSYIVQTIAGSDFTGDNGPASKALLATVEGVAADALGNSYISDTDSHKIRRVSPKGIITTIAGTGKAGFSGDGGLATLAQLNLPYGLAVDFTGNLYVADFGNHCVRKISPDGHITTVAGLSNETQMAGPRNLAVDASGNLYVSDFIASRVFRRTPQGVFTAYAGSATAIALGDTGPATLARLKNPAGLAVDLAGTLYIADSGNKRVRKVSAGIITTLGAAVATPIGLTVNYIGELYVADAGAGLFLRITNLGGDKPTVKAWPEPCRDIAVDFSGNVLVSSGNTVKQFNGSSFNLFAGGKSYLLAGDESSALTARLNRPMGLARDPAGNLYVADSANKRIRRITPDGVIHTFLDGLTAPAGLAFDGFTGNLYIADAGAHAVFVWKPDGTLTNLAGNHQGYSGDGGPAKAAQLNAPSAVAYDSLAGTLYIADEGNNRVRKLTPDGVIQTLAKLQAPAGLAIDALGRLFASESGGGRVVIIQPSGTADSISNAGLWVNPRGLAIDSGGALYIADPGTQRITRVDPEGTVSLAAGNGTADFKGDGNTGALASFDTPSALVADPAGVVLVSDTGNNRVRSLTPDKGIAAPITAAPQLITAVNAASRMVGAVAAGELIAILGTGVEFYDIQIDSTPVAALTTGPGEATVSLPDTLDPKGAVEIQLLSQGIPQARLTLSLAAASLGLFPRLTRNEDGTVNESDNPASRGSPIRIYGTGEGRGGVSLTATLDGQPMDILSVAPAADSPGRFELIAYVPSGYFPAGPKVLRVSSGASTSQPGVTVFVR